MDERRTAWSELLDVLPLGGAPDGRRMNPAARLWELAAIWPKVGGRRGPAPKSETGRDVDEAAAVCDLVARLRAGSFHCGVDSHSAVNTPRRFGLGSPRSLAGTTVRRSATMTQMLAAAQARDFDLLLAG